MTVASAASTAPASAASSTAPLSSSSSASSSARAASRRPSAAARAAACRSSSAWVAARRDCAASTWPTRRPCSRSCCETRALCSLISSSRESRLARAVAAVADARPSTSSASVTSAVSRTASSRASSIIRGETVADMPGSSACCPSRAMRWLASVKSERRWSCTCSSPNETWRASSTASPVIDCSSRPWRSRAWSSCSCSTIRSVLRSLSPRESSVMPVRSSTTSSASSRARASRTMAAIVWASRAISAWCPSGLS